MLEWSPFWRWLATGVLAAMTVAWVAQGHPGSREPRFATSHEGWRMQMMPGMMSTAGAAKVTATGNAVAGSASPVMSAALQRQRTELQRQEVELQQQQAQLSAHLAAIQARLSSLGQ
jgi:hypothetical protein